MKKISVLWIEDGARIDLPYLAAPVYMDGRFNLVLAENISQAVDLLRATEFQILIVDIRMPPGLDRQWIEAFSEGRTDKANARLGLKLMRSLLKPDQAEVKLTDLPDWVKTETMQNRIGVLTVEGSELKPVLDALGIKAYLQKTAGMNYRSLLDLVEEVLANSEPS